jgi:hypothetical protein
MIGLLIIGGALLGAIIGRFFKVLVLIPVCVVAIALQWMNCQTVDNTVLYSLASVSLLILSLEFGYFIGCFQPKFPPRRIGAR